MSWGWLSAAGLEAPVSSSLLMNCTGPCGLLDALHRQPRLPACQVQAVYGCPALFTGALQACSLLAPFAAEPAAPAPQAAQPGGFDDLDDLLGGPSQVSAQSSQADLHREEEDLLSGFASSGPIQPARPPAARPQAAAQHADPFDMFASAPAAAPRAPAPQPAASGDFLALAAWVRQRAAAAAA